MADIAKWLLAQIAEDERVANAARGADTAFAVSRLPTIAFAHVVAWGPDRVLRECEAKRRIVESLTYLDAYTYVRRPDGYLAHVARERPVRVPYVERDDVLMLLALPYADRPGYRDEWRPTA